LRQPVVGCPPGVRLAQLHVTCRRDDAGGSCKAADQFARGKLLVGDCG
jgi:hypothetical protein